MTHELDPKQRPASTGTESEAGTPPKVQAVFDRLLPSGVPGLVNPDQIIAAMKLAAGIEDNRPDDFDIDD